MKKLTTKIISKIVKDKFLSAAFWMFLGAGFMNVGNYLYHLLMARMLGVSLYGALESIISALYIISVPTLTINLVIVKYVSSHKGRREHELIGSLYSYVLKKLLFFGSLIFMVLLATSGVIKSFLHLPSSILVILLALSFFINLFYFLNKSMLQGVSSFFKLSVLNFFESFIKVSLAVLLVYLGFKAEGAYAAIIISIIIPLFFSYIYIKDIVRAQSSIQQKYLYARDLLKFSLPTFLTSFALISMFTTDVILVRHFFPGAASGYYSALSVLGKIIYFAVSPIVLVLFPMISEHHAKGESFQRILILGTVITFAFSFLITLIFFFAPESMILLLFGKRYLLIANMLGLFGIFVSLLSLVSLFANFYLSIHKTFPSYMVGFAAIMQVILISIFHKNLFEIIFVSLGITFLLLISLLLYYPRAKNS